MSPHFLCCLPIRLGAFLVALIEIPISFIVAAACWFAIVESKKKENDISLTTAQYIGVGILAAGYSLMFFASLFGLIGVLAKKINWVRTFKSTLQSFLIFHVVTVILNVIFYFVDKKDVNCVVVDSDGKCVGTGLSKAVGIVVVLIFLLVPLAIEAYGCWIVSDCVRYLESREMSGPLYPFASSYAAVAPKEEHVSLTHANYNYSSHPQV